MAKGKNILLHGFSGKIGDLLVIRQVGDKTILSKAPDKRDKEPTEAQKAQRKKFQEATIYAKATLKNEALKEEYQAKAKGQRSAYHIAVADFLKAPDIDEIDMNNYTGQTGDTIRIRAIDDFKVEQVQVSIMNADGTLVEEGDAILAENELDWIYTATADNTDLEGDKIIVRVSDKPGNISSVEEQLGE
jgi:hypothetical protein